MTIKETKDFLERIKTYYQSFMIDDYIIKEWHSQLKDYSSQDINGKFNEHLKSEEFSNYVPKIAFLTKYLTKENEKGNNNKEKIKTNCQLCGEEVTLAEYEDHYHKCSSICYIITQYKKYTGKEINREKLENATQEQFDNIYDQVLKLVYGNTNDEQQKHCIEMLLGDKNE